MGGGRGLGKGGQVGALRQPNVVLHDSWGFLLLGVRVLHEGVGVRVLHDSCGSCSWVLHEGVGVRVLHEGVGVPAPG